MENTFFLGANTAAGFRSLYGGFGRGAGDYLRIVKGGPGTGKSGFMRAIGREAARRGHDVEYVRCSGDPASLDGVYIPALRLAYVDGTAPHAAEPGVFGVDSDYVNLGVFCRTPFSDADAARAAALSAEYKAKYARAYALLSAGEQIERALTPTAPDEKTARRAQDALRALVERAAPEGGGEASLSRRFAGAISCEGLVRDESALAPCRLIYCCEDGCGLAAGALAAARDEALARGLGVVECLSPFDGRTCEAVLLPALSTAFVSAAPSAGNVRRAARRERARCVEAACAVLAEAKELHDELEAVCRPYMDFPALDAFTAKELARLFS